MKNVKIILLTVLTALFIMIPGKAQAITADYEHVYNDPSAELVLDQEIMFSTKGITGVELSWEYQSRVDLDGVRILTYRLTIANHTGVYLNDFKIFAPFMYSSPKSDIAYPGDWDNEACAWAFDTESGNVEYRSVELISDIYEISYPTRGSMQYKGLLDGALSEVLWTKEEGEEEVEEVEEPVNGYAQESAEDTVAMVRLGNLAPDETVELDVVFKIPTNKGFQSKFLYTGVFAQQESYQVIYRDGMDNSAFEEMTFSELSYGDLTPEFPDGIPTLDGYTFVGWDKEIADQVTENVVYTAVWEPVPTEENTIVEESTLESNETETTAAETTAAETTAAETTAAEDGNTELGTSPETGREDAPLMYMGLLAFGSFMGLMVWEKRRRH